ncbi:cation:dicarboxylase symporter family transporter [candidate division KSB1 bacterium]|nr:cation:dicarboxylase symporter family transporter [candidate division KSB1 bacterium]
MKLPKLQLSTQIFIGILIGIIVGVLFGENLQIVKSLGDIFIRLLKMIVVPLVIIPITTFVITSKTVLS